MDSHAQAYGMLPVPKHSKELQTAVQDEGRRQQIDAAKKRAASQNVDYAAFAALVSMAHVKPFERRRGRREELVQSVPALPAWSFDATGGLAPSDSSQGTCKELGDLKITAQQMSEEAFHWKKTEDPMQQEEAGFLATRLGSFGHREHAFMTSDAFKREWRRAGSNLQDKLTFLLAIPPHELPYIFKVELPPSILADIIDALCLWRQSSAQEGVGVLLPSCLGSGVKETPTHKVTDRGNFVACNSTFNKPFDAHLTFHMLESLCKCGRFSLSLKLVGAMVRSSAIGLIGHILDCLRGHAVCNEKAHNTLCSSCYAEMKGHVEVGSPEGSTAIKNELLEGQLICMDKAKELASIYSMYNYAS